MTEERKLRKKDSAGSLCRHGAVGELRRNYACSRPDVPRHSALRRECDEDGRLDRRKHNEEELVELVGQPFVIVVRYII